MCSAFYLSQVVWAEGRGEWVRGKGEGAGEGRVGKREGRRGWGGESG